MIIRQKIFVVQQCTVQFTNQFSRVQATMLKCLLSRFIKFVTSKKITSNLTFKYNKSPSQETKPFKMIGKQPPFQLYVNLLTIKYNDLVRKINGPHLAIPYCCRSRYQTWTMVGMS